LTEVVEVDVAVDVAPIVDLDLAPDRDPRRGCDACNDVKVQSRRWSRRQTQRLVEVNLNVSWRRFQALFYMSSARDAALRVGDPTEPRSRSRTVARTPM